MLAQLVKSSVGTGAKAAACTPLCLLREGKGEAREARAVSGARTVHSALHP